jgi:pimeloyl-ACP methyl ester carboxylesterase
MNTVQTIAAVLVAGATLCQAQAVEDERDRCPAWSAVAGMLDTVAGRATTIASTADQQLRSAAGAAGEYFHRHAAAAQRMRGTHIFAVDEGAGPSWLPVDEVELPERVVLLIHGLDEPGRVWDDLAPALAAAGHRAARFDYPNDQPIADSADLLADTLRDLHGRGIRHIDLICHSKGGLVARDLLTRDAHYAGSGRDHADLPDVHRLIMLGTPNEGSHWARLQCISEAAEQVDRWVSDPNLDPRQLLGFLADGRGEAARDLFPGSAFLQDLNARPMPADVAVTAIIAVIGPASEACDGDASDAGATPTVDRIAEFGRRASQRLGDGVVSVNSAAPAELEDVVYVRASHRGMVRASRIEGAVRWAARAPIDAPPAIPIILDRLAAQ